MRAAILVVLGACSFEHGALRGDAGAGGDTLADAALARMDGMPPSACVEAWMAGPSFVAPVELTTLDESDAGENDPFVTRDELTIYFARGGNIWRATRGSATASFDPPSEYQALNSSASESKLSFTDDELTAFFNSGRTGSTGTDVWRATRQSVTSSFTIDRMYLANVNTTDSQWDPHISGDGLRLYLAPTSMSAAQAIAVAARQSTTDSFSVAQTIAELDSDMVDNDPTLSGDERVIVFASNRGGNRNLWYAVRVDRQAPFGTPIMVPSLNLGTEDGAHLSYDGCRLYFTSDRNGDSDIFVAQVQ